MPEKSGLSDTASAINQSGAFLQSLVIHELNKAKWFTDSEFPVQAAPFIDDPVLHKMHFTTGSATPIYEPTKFVKSMSYCQNNMELEETSIDVIAAASSEGSDKLGFKLCIECKKLDPSYSDWIFFDPGSKRPMNIITKDITSKGFVSLFKIPGTSRCGNEIHIDLNRFESWDPFKHLISNSSIAVSNKKIPKLTYETKKSLIDNAARQIIKGSYGFILNDIQQQILSGVGYEHRTVVFVPIVLTTANLTVCKIDPLDINPVTGYIEKEPSYEKINSIIYECGTPKSVRFPHPQFNQLSVEHKRAVQKWHVLIFSPEGFVSFLKDLKSTDLVN